MFGAILQKNRTSELRPLADRGGQRVIKDRRFFQYGVFSPDNRNWKDRRNSLDRRKKPRYVHSEKIIKLDSEKSEEVLFKISANTNSVSPIHSKENTLSKNASQKETMFIQEEYQPDSYYGLPKHWHLQDPLDEVYFSEVIRRDLDENAYITYCIDTYNSYRLTAEQKTKFESFNNSTLNNIRVNMYSRNDLIDHFKQL